MTDPAIPRTTRTPRTPRAPLPGGVAAGLQRAPAAELRELVAGYLRSFTLREARQVLRNPYVDAEIIDELAAARHLSSIYEVQRAVARHRRTPQAVAMRFIPGLFWRDLNEIALDVHVHPSVRRTAEKYLAQRMARLTVGEKVNLARRTSHAILAHLRHDPNPRVIAALLENPRLTEEILLPLAAVSDSPRVLDLLARSPWGRPYAVRAALARNAAAPLRAILAILPTLRRGDLLEIAGLEAHVSPVRNRARDLLEEGFDPRTVSR